MDVQYNLPQKHRCLIPLCVLFCLVPTFGTIWAHTVVPWPQPHVKRNQRPQKYWKWQQKMTKHVCICLILTNFRFDLGTGFKKASKINGLEEILNYSSRSEKVNMYHGQAWQCNSSDTFLYVFQLKIQPKVTNNPF